jgi:TPR repeat protein
MGIICLYGFGVEKNLETAREWLEKAASQDHAQAKAALKALPDAGTGKDTPS